MSEVVDSSPVRLTSATGLYSIENEKKDAGWIVDESGEEGGRKKVRDCSELITNLH